MSRETPWVKRQLVQLSWSFSSFSSSSKCFFSTLRRCESLSDTNCCDYSLWNEVVDRAAKWPTQVIRRPCFDAQWRCEKVLEQDAWSSNCSSHIIVTVEYLNIATRVDPVCWCEICAEIVFVVTESRHSPSEIKDSSFLVHFILPVAVKCNTSHSLCHVVLIAAVDERVQETSE